MTSYSRALCGAILCTVSLASCAEEGPQAPPNILFIAIDDLNDWVGPLEGHPQVSTPHMDRLAARGTTFYNAHTQAPLCNPARTSLLTGRRPSSTGIYGLAPWFREVETLKDIETLPQYLARQGYATYSTGKIYHGRYGRDEGDSEFQVLGPRAGVGARPDEPLVHSPSGHALMDWGTFPHEDEDKGDWAVASWAVEQLQGSLKGPQERPFFLAAGFFLPHVPCYVTQKWYDMYPKDSVALPAVRRDDREDTPRFSWYLHWKLPEPRLKFLEEAGEWRNLVASYLGSISFVDSQVGRLIDALDASGHAEDTVVVLWSDHGWHLGEKLITGKNTLWDRSARVPLIFAGPGVSAGARVTSPAELLDIYPTLIDLAGLPAQEGLEGHSLLPQLRNAAAPREWPAITTHNAGNHGVRSERWRYIVYADGSEELYDMQSDPQEFDNLAGDPRYAEVVAEHRRFLPVGDLPPAPGSRARVLTYEGGRVTWEGEDVGADDPVPEL